MFHDHCSRGPTGRHRSRPCGYSRMAYLLEASRIPLDSLAAIKDPFAARGHVVVHSACGLGLRQSRYDDVRTSQPPASSA
jgi:hypothetical protein